MRARGVSIDRCFAEAYLRLGRICMAKDSASRARRYLWKSFKKSPRPGTLMRLVSTFARSNGGLEEMREMTISKMDRGGQNAVVSAGPGAIAAATRECASFAGFFKKGLSPSERERMKALLGQGFGGGARLTALEGRNSTVLFEEAAEGLQPVGAAGGGGP